LNQNSAIEVALLSYQFSGESMVHKKDAITKKKTENEIQVKKMCG